jgi:two-component system, NarL family, invasion response regulator UvrY
MLRVLIADDHFRVRQGLREILQQGPETTVVGEAKTGLEAVEQARAESWDVVVLDINLPDQSGLEVLRAIKRERPTLPVLLLSLHPGSQYIKGSLKAGASGFLSKETAPEELRAAIDTVLAGGVYVSRALAGE